MLDHGFFTHDKHLTLLLADTAKMKPKGEIKSWAVTSCKFIITSSTFQITQIHLIDCS